MDATVLAYATTWQYNIYNKTVSQKKLRILEMISVDCSLNAQKTQK